MPEVKRPVRTIEVNYVCDKCGHGMMRKSADMNPETGEVPHKCVICGYAQTFKWLSYPRIDYVGENDKI